MRFSWLTAAGNLVRPTFSFPRRASTIFQRPLISSVWVTVAVCGKESTAMLPEPWPNPFAIRLRKLEPAQCLTRKELEGPFTMVGRQRLQLWPHFEQEHEPVCVGLIAMFADDARQVQVAGPNLQPQFFLCLTAGAGERRFAFVRVQFAARWTPEAKIWLLRSLQQEHFVACVEAIEQRGDFVGQRHAASKAGGRKTCKKAAQDTSVALVNLSLLIVILILIP